MLFSSATSGGVLAAALAPTPKLSVTASVIKGAANAIGGGMLLNMGAGFYAISVQNWESIMLLALGGSLMALMAVWA